VVENKKRKAPKELSKKLKEKTETIEPEKKLGKIAKSITISEEVAPTSEPKISIVAAVSQNWKKLKEGKLGSIINRIQEVIDNDKPKEAPFWKKKSKRSRAEKPVKVLEAPVKDDLR
jgi:hypothetical protein